MYCSEKLTFTVPNGYCQLLYTYSKETVLAACIYEEKIGVEKSINFQKGSKEEK